MLGYWWFGEGSPSTSLRFSLKELLFGGVNQLLSTSKCQKGGTVTCLSPCLPLVGSCSSLLTLTSSILTIVPFSVLTDSCRIASCQGKAQTTTPEAHAKQRQRGVLLQKDRGEKCLEQAEALQFT